MQVKRFQAELPIRAFNKKRQLLAHKCTEHIGRALFTGVGQFTGLPVIEAAVIEGAVQRLHHIVLAIPVPILWSSDVYSDVMKPIAASVVGGMITSTIHVLILVPVFSHHGRACSAEWISSLFERNRTVVPPKAIPD